MGEQIYLAGVDGVECNLGDVIVALSVTTTGETRPVNGMRMRGGWIYCFENTGNTGRMYVCTYICTREREFPATERGTD